MPYKEFFDYQECPEPYYKKPLPNYEVVPLKYNDITVATIQMKTKTVDPKNPKPAVKENVDHLCHLADAAFMWPRGPKHLLCFPEFCLTGWSFDWTREDYLRIAIELPGEETEIIGKKAKQLNCYMAVACHTKENDWPGHYSHTSFIVSPEGKVIHRHWKAHRDPGRGEWATTVHDVLDEFVERYGWDAVWPVARTDIGNIATFICSEGFQPETARAFAFKGAEILVRLISGGAYVYSEAPFAGDPRITMRSYSMENSVYGIYCCGGLWAQQLYENAMGGSSMIIDPNGRILKQSESPHETVISDIIPIAYFRQRHSIPFVRKELYDRVYAEHVGKYPPNMYSEYLPKDAMDANTYARRKARW